MEQVKQPSPSVNPANQLLSKLGKIILSLNTIGFKFILPLLIQILNPSTNFSNFIFLLGNTRLLLNKLISISISFLLCVTYLLVNLDCAITLPKPKVSFIKSNICISLLFCIITKLRLPLLFTINKPSPSVNPINQVKNFSEGGVLLGK